MGAKHRKPPKPEPFEPRVTVTTHAVAFALEGFYRPESMVPWDIVRDYLKRSGVRVRLARPPVLDPDGGVHIIGEARQ